MKSGRRAAVLAALLAFAAPATAAPRVDTGAAPFVITVPSGKQPHIPLAIKRANLDVRLALSFDSALILNSGPAARAELKAFPLIGKRTFKNALIPGGEATFRGNLYSIVPSGLPKSTLPTIWVDKPIAGDADGVLPLSALKADHIAVVLGPQAPGSIVYTVARKNKGSATMETVIGGQKIDISFELNSPDTVMNARAAAALTAAGLVKRAGSIGYWVPFPGVVLPFERLVPAPGATLIGLPLRGPGARVTEAQAKAIDVRAKAGTSSESDDEDAIIVTASRKKGRDPWILIGRDVLSSCSRIEFDRPGKVWKLTCIF